MDYKKYILGINLGIWHLDYIEKFIYAAIMVFILISNNCEIYYR